MATGKLKAKDVIREGLKPGRYSDGEGLYLVVTPGGTRNWVFLCDVKIGDRKVRRELGLGGFPKGAEFSKSREDARTKATAYRDVLKAGRDPKDFKDNVAIGADVKTFGAAADKYMVAKGANWKNPKHRQQWRNTLNTYASALMSRPAHTITTGDVVAVLQPIWTEKPETASRVRHRISRVWLAAKADDRTTKRFEWGANPAEWTGNLEHELADPDERTARHHAAMSCAAVPGFVGALRSAEGVSPAALEFTILTAARTGEVIGARWSEFDLASGVWTVPASRMKAKVEHRVPLSDRALAILGAMLPLKRRDDGHVFPGRSYTGGLSNMAMSAVLKRLKHTDITVHGFRSTFRDWASEITDFPREVCEKALAHTIRNKTEGAYRRGDLFDKRRPLMAAWATFCEPADAASVVTPMRAVG